MMDGDALEPVGHARPYRILMGAVFAVALIAAYSMLPDDNELIAMLERDGHSGDAIAILEENYNQGDRRYRMLHQLLALYENEGATQKARLIFEEMVNQRPGDAALRERVARFYRVIGDGRARRDALKAQIDLRFNESACREYISLVRLEGEAQAEIEAIQHCRQKGYRRPDDLLRLGVLLAATGERTQCVNLLRAIDDVRRLKTTEDRQLLVSLLLDQQQPNEAERRAIRWIKSGNNQALALSIVDELAAARFSDSALRVAKAAGAQGDSISLTVAERLLEQSQGQAARIYLKGWLEAADFESVEILERFIAATIEAEDPQAGLSGAKKFGLGRLPAAARANLVKALSERGYSADAATLSEASGVPGAQQEPLMGEQPAGLAKSSQDAKARGTADQRRVAPEVATDSLATWRRVLASRMSEDAQRRLPATLVHDRGPHTDRVFKKAAKVLQRSRHLKSLKQRRHGKAAQGKN